MFVGCSKINSEIDEKYLSALLLLRYNADFQECNPIERKFDEEYNDLIGDVKVIGDTIAIANVKEFKDIVSFAFTKDISFITFRIKLKAIPSSGVIYSESFSNLVSRYEFQINSDDKNIYTVGLEKKYDENLNFWNLKETKPIVRKNSDNEFLCDMAIVMSNLITFSCNMANLKNVSASDLNIRLSSVHLDSGKVFSDCL